MKLFDIRNRIASLFRNGFIRLSDFENPKELEPKLKSEKSIAERTKSRKLNLDEIAKNENKINIKFFRQYFKYLNARAMYNELSDAKTQK